MNRILHWMMIATACGFVAFTTGCKTIARENIISSINTGIGITVAENPKTEMYEVKVGYIRSQFYSVPTGKTVEDECSCPTNGASHHSNRAQDTPELVAGIRMESGIEQLLVGLKVSESFAVGKTAVMSPAAVAMYISNADSPGKALAASSAVAAAAKSTSAVRVIEHGDKIAEIARIYQQSPTDKEKVDKAIGDPKGGGFKNWNEFLDGNPSAEQLDFILGEIKKP